MRMRIYGFAVVALALLLVAGCENVSDTAKGAGIGAAAGGVLGGVAGHNIRGLNTTEGALGGALVGGALGGLMGHQQDQMKRQQQQIDAANRAANTLVINIQNSNGSTTPVVLTRVGTQWQGPKGEMYDNPTVEQLRPVYGF